MLRFAAVDIHAFSVRSGGSMGRLDKLIRVLHQIMLIVAGLALAAMIVVTIGNIGSRLLWAPIKGTVELTGFFGAIAAAFALGATQLRAGHTAVDILILKFSKGTQQLLRGANAIIGTIFFCLAGWQLVRWGTTLRITGEITETLRIIYYPFVYAVALGCFAMALVLAADFIKALGASRGA
jgi:TRAP-type C4-dicarboxylate transport system permease small subunit